MCTDDQIFENIAVYDRLHYALINLFPKYIETHLADLRIRRSTFFKLT